MDDTKWFGVRTFYRWAPSSHDAPGTVRYEERVTLIRARDFDDALARGEALAEHYARELEADYLGYIDTFEIYDEITDGAEVYSSTRMSALPPKEYLDRHLDHTDGAP